MGSHLLVTLRYANVTDLLVPYGAVCVFALFNGLKRMTAHPVLCQGAVQQMQATC